MIETGVIHGRFQILHNDHLTYLLAGKAECQHLVVGITNPDPTLTKADSADPKRSGPLANPLTYYERYVMVRVALEEAGVPTGDFSIVPLPINLPKLYQYYVPLDATFFLTIYDDWGCRKLAQFQALGLKTLVLWERPLSQKGLSGSDIRQRMIQGQPWEHLLPTSTQTLMKQWGIPSRLQRLHAEQAAG